MTQEGRAGKTSGDADTLIFAKGRFRSTACDRYEYGDGAYTATSAGDTIAFEAETESPKYGKLQWKGVVRGRKLDGTLTMVRNGKAAGEKWVVAGETSEPDHSARTEENGMSRLAVVQTPPVFLDRKQTLAKAAASVHEAAQGGARLVVFPEAFIPGYPAWIWRLRPGGDMRLTEQLHALLRANAVDLSGNDLAPLREAARKEKVAVVCGVHERDAEFGGGTLYNTVVVIGPDGALLNRHRKLMPTNPERMVWGFGDASGLKPVETPCGRVGVLICWESYMPLARYALYAQGIDVYVAPTYDSGDRCVATMQHIAREGGCWVAGGGCAFRAKDIPDEVPGKAELFRDPDEWVNPGDSVIVAPGGKIVSGPLHEEFGILYADIDLERVGMARRSLDVVGHYSRPDVFRLEVNTKPLRPVEFTGAPEYAGREEK